MVIGNNDCASSLRVGRWVGSCQVKGLGCGTSYVRLDEVILLAGQRGIKMCSEVTCPLTHTMPL